MGSITVHDIVILWALGLALMFLLKAFINHYTDKYNRQIQTKQAAYSKRWAKYTRFKYWNKRGNK